MHKRLARMAGKVTKDVITDPRFWVIVIEQVTDEDSVLRNSFNPPIDDTDEVVDISEPTPSDSD
jgi:hypothetical protein